MKILCTISNEDAKKITDSITEINYCKVLYESAIQRIDCSPIALKTIISYYIEQKKAHWNLWENILINYIGKEETLNSFNQLRFNKVDQTIIIDDNKGCATCKL